MKTKRRLRFRLGLVLLMLALPYACSDNLSVADPGPDGRVCSIPQKDLLNGGPGKDGIPALTNPTFVSSGDIETVYLQPEDRVVGVVLDSEPLALPLNIFWWHEIVNLDGNGLDMSVTHCPLTGSTLAFDRSAVAGAEFGVSGLLFHNNLVMYDRNNSESLWPQMLRGARCGPADGTALQMVPVIETTWQGWLTLHPDTRVISGNTGFVRDYTNYPYGNYDDPGNTRLLFPGNVDTRRPPKERVLGIPQGSGGIAFPFGLLGEEGAISAITPEGLNEPTVILWDKNKQAAMAYRSRLDGVELEFSVTDGKIVDRETGSVWRVDGRAVTGPLAGEELEPIPEAFIAYWFAWPTFYPDIEIWGAP
jgi:hypothetical protein